MNRKRIFVLVGTGEITLYSKSKFTGLFQILELSFRWMDNLDGSVPSVVRMPDSTDRSALKIFWNKKREFGNYEEEFLNDAYLDFNEAKVRGLEPDTFYKFELAGLVTLGETGEFSAGPWVEITARTVGPGLNFQPGTPYPDGSGFAAQVRGLQV